MDTEYFDRDRYARQALVSRRVAIASAASAALAGAPAAAGDAVTALLARVAEKNAAFMRGDMQRWSDLTPIAQDFTLMQPFGGAPSHGFDTSPARLERMARFFRNGVSALEIAQVHATQDLVVLATVERQTGEVGGLPMQDWSLRVTEVWRRAAGEWRLAHRHADPLVAARSLPQTAALARGPDGKEG